MTNKEYLEMMWIITQAFKKPYPPELENREGKVAWRENVVKTDLKNAFQFNTTE